MRWLVLALALLAAACGDSDPLVAEERINAPVGQVADGSSDAVPGDNASVTDDGATSPDGADVVSEATTDVIGPGDGPVEVADGDVPAAPDGADAPSPSDAPDASRPDVTDAGGTDASDAADAPDVPGPRCGDGLCAVTETCESCSLDCGSCPPVDGGMDVGSPTDRGSDTGTPDVAPPADRGPEAGPDVPDVTSPTDAPDASRPDTGDTDVPDAADAPDATDAPDVPGPRCGDRTCTPSAGETCESCSADCGPCPPRCGDGTCNGTETCMSCPGDCSSGYPTLVQEYTGAIGGVMASVEIRLRSASGPAVSPFRSNPCVGGLTRITGGFRCVVDIVQLMGVCGSPMPTGTHLVFRDGAGNRLLTNRVAGMPGAICYASTGSVPCIRSTSNGRLYSDPIYTGFAGETDPRSGQDLLFFNLGVEAPEIR